MRHQASMARQIPTTVIAVVSDALANRYTHAAIDQMMEAAGLELNPSPGGSKQVKTRGWFSYANNTSSDPLGTLGKVVAEFMEKDNDEWDKSLHSDQERVRKTLAKHGLSYVQGGYIQPLGATAVSNTLQDIIRARNLSGLQTEFNRIYENLEADPPSAVTASCALLESLFKTYIEDNNLETKPTATAGCPGAPPARSTWSLCTSAIWTTSLLPSPSGSTSRRHDMRLKYKNRLLRRKEDALVHGDVLVHEPRVLEAVSHRSRRGGAGDSPRSDPRG